LHGRFLTQLTRRRAGRHRRAVRRCRLGASSPASAARAASVRKPPEAFTPETIQRQFDVNVFGQMRVSRAFLPAMRERRSGLVVYVTSVVGRYTFPFGGVYASSKWALEALAESSSYELGPLGVDVAIVQPTAYETNIGNSGVGPDDEQRLSGYGV
jgi:NAD(P)-dependent dehydrogenase (short-subunit alcohol dehydrogenase family)